MIPIVLSLFDFLQFDFFFFLSFLRPSWNGMMRFAIAVSKAETLEDRIVLLDAMLKIEHLTVFVF